MFQWRVTKYNPKHRDVDGKYLHDEWTSIADVGRTFTDGGLTLESYLNVESAYVDTATQFIEESGAPRLFARDVEATNVAAAHGAAAVIERPPREGEEIVLADLARLCRLCLRELLWCRIESADGTCFVHFGYDFYMYVGSPIDCRRTIDFARRIGLFVEPRESPYRER